MTRSILWFHAFLIANSNIPKGQCSQWLIKDDRPIDPVEYQSGELQKEGEYLVTRIEEGLSDDDHQLHPRSGRSLDSPPPPTAQRLPTSWVTADGNIDTAALAQTGQRAWTSLSNWGRTTVVDYLQWLKERKLRERQEREIIRAVAAELEGTPRTPSPPQGTQRRRSKSTTKVPPRNPTPPLKRQLVSVASKKLRDSDEPDSQKLLMECLSKAVAKMPLKLLAMTSATSYLASIPRVGEHFTPTPEVANPDIARVVTEFVKEAMPCFGYFNRDINGNLQFDPNVAMRNVSNAVKQSRNLNVAVAQALVENVKVTTDSQSKPQYDINLPGLATSLGMTYTRSATVGGNSLYRGGATLSRMWNKVSTDDSQEPLMECLKKALVSVPIQALAMSSAKEALVTIPFLGGFFHPTPETTPTKPIDLVHSFVDAALPCFKYFKKGAHGKFMFDQEYAVSSAIQAANQHPDLPHAVAKALADSVREKPPTQIGEEPQFDIDYEGLTAALKTAAATSSKDRIEQMLDNFYGRDSGIDPDEPKDNLIDCLISAVGTIQLGRIIVSSAASVACSLWGDTRPQTLTSEAPNIVQSFVDAAKPCFNFYKQDEEGNLMFDKNYTIRTAIEAARWNPMTSLILSVAEAIKKNVNIDLQNEDGDAEYDINLDGLALDLGRALLRSTKIGCYASMIFGFP